MQSATDDQTSASKGDDARLALLVNRIVHNYVLARAQERSGVNLERYKEGYGGERRVNWKAVPSAFGKEQEKVAMGLFLEFRSRRDQAFVQHFAQTFFAVPQYMSASDGDQQCIAKALLDEERVDDVKTLTLMALSANSWTPKSDNEKGSAE